MDKIPVTFMSCDAADIYNGAIYNEYPVCISLNQVTYFHPAKDDDFTEIIFVNGNSLFVKKRYDNFKAMIKTNRGIF